MFKLVATIGYYVLKASAVLAGPIVFLSLILKRKIEKEVDGFVGRHPYVLFTVMVLWILLCFSALIGVLVGIRF